MICTMDPDDLPTVIGDILRNETITLPEVNCCSPFVDG